VSVIDANTVHGNTRCEAFCRWENSTKHHVQSITSLGIDRLSPRPRNQCLERKSSEQTEPFANHFPIIWKFIVKKSQEFQFCEFILFLRHEFHCFTLPSHGSFWCAVICFSGFNDSQDIVNICLCPFTLILAKNS
jgi:hypothetical protein